MIEMRLGLRLAPAFVVGVACAHAPPPRAEPVARVLPAPSAPRPKADDTERRVVELYRQGCEDGSGDGCNWLGVAYQSGEHGLQKDADVAFDYFVKACDASNGWGCTNLGAVLLDVEETHRDLKRARTASEKGCNLGGPRGCTLAGTAALIQNDDAAAFALATRGCDGDDALGCALLARLHLDGRGTKKDTVRALELYTRSCNASAAVGCFMAGRLIFRGDGTTKDAARGVSLYERACTMGHATACNDLGVAYWDGTGVAVDLARAKTLLEKACKMHEGVACTNLARLIQQP